MVDNADHLSIGILLTAIETLYLVSALAGSLILEEKDPVF